VRVWDTTTWRLLHVLTGHDGYVRSVAGTSWTAVSGAEDHVVAVWDLRSGALRARLVGHRRSVDRVAVSGDGRYAASVSRDNDVLLWDLARYRLSREFYRSGMLMVDLGPSLYQTFGRNTSGRGHAEAPHGLAFGTDGRVYTANREVIGWDVDDGTETGRLDVHSRPIRALVAEPEGLLAVADHAVQRYGPDGTVLAAWLAPRPAHAPFVAAASTPEGGAVTLDEAGCVQHWPACTGPEAWWARHTGEVLRVRVDPIGRYAATVGRDDHLMVWELAEATRTAVVPDVDAIGGPDAAYTPDGRHVVIALRTGDVLVQPTAGGPPTTLTGTAPATDVAAVDDERLLVVHHDRPPEIRRLDGTGEPWPLRGANGTRYGDLSRFVTADGQYAVIMTQVLVDGQPLNAVQCWDLHRGGLIWTRSGAVEPETHYDWMGLLGDRTVVFRAACQGAYRIMVVDLPTNRIRQRIRADVWHTLLGRRPDGALVLDDLTDLWVVPVRARRPRRHMPSPPGIERRLVAGADLLLSITGPTVLAHRFSTGALLAVAELPCTATALATSADGATAVVGDEHGNVHVFRLPQPHSVSST